LSTAAYHNNMREAWGRALVALGEKNSDVVALEADLGKSTRSIYFKEAFPERYFEMGIAEQNMISTAAGLALGGKVPFVHSFAVFAAGRTYDQLRNSVCIPNRHLGIQLRGDTGRVRADSGRNRRCSPGFAGVLNRWDGVLIKGS
jgi:transketolase C-terminal domain/subunit